MKILYKTLNAIRRLYWFVFRPSTQGVKCLIENNGAYLLIQTSYSGTYWTLPGGGIGHTETDEQAARREVDEELGIMITVVTKIGQYESTAEYKKDIIHLFYAQVLSRDFKKNNAEVSVAQWFKKDALPENQSKALRMSLSLI